MAENDAPTPAPDEPAPVPPDATVEQTAVAAEAVPAEPKQRFTDRLWNFRAMVAVALAALLLGGGLGAAITAASHDDEADRHGYLRFGDGPPGFPGGPGPYGGPGGFGPGQRQEFREDLQDMRDWMEKRQEKRQERRQERRQDAPLPTPSETPNS